MAPPSFAANDSATPAIPLGLTGELATTLRLLRHNMAATRRAEAVKARSDTRTWVMDRRARTRRLIELGGLVEKSGIYAAMGEDDPDAALLGAMMGLRDAVEGDGESDAVSAADRIALWRRRGRRALRGTDLGGEGA